MSDFEPEDVAAADEVMQILYWLRGEGLLADVAVADVQRFLDANEAELTAVFERLVRLGLVARIAPGGVGARYALTPDGVREGGRRFADEFADITRPGHGECGDPECDCHTTGNPADCTHHHHS
jgi:hypothetical protein